MRGFTSKGTFAFVLLCTVTVLIALFETVLLQKTIHLKSGEIHPSIAVQNSKKFMVYSSLSGSTTRKTILSDPKSNPLVLLEKQKRSSNSLLSSTKQLLLFQINGEKVYGNEALKKKIEQVFDIKLVHYIPEHTYIVYQDAQFMFDQYNAHKDSMQDIVLFIGYMNHENKVGINENMFILEEHTTKLSSKERSLLRQRNNIVHYTDERLQESINNQVLVLHAQSNQVRTGYISLNVEITEGEKKCQETYVAGSGSSNDYCTKQIREVIESFGKCTSSLEQNKLLQSFYQKKFNEIVDRKVLVLRGSSTHFSVNIPLDCTLGTVHLLKSLPFVISVSISNPIAMRNREGVSYSQSGRAPTATNSRPFHSVGISGQNEIIAVCDSGVDVDHCAFNGVDDVPLNNVNNSLTKVISYITFCRDGKCSVKNDDKNGHGTHVAGSALGKFSDNAMSDYNGVAPEAKLIAQGLAGADKGFVIPVDTYTDMFKKAYDYGARIHTNSWGDSLPYECEFDCVCKDKNDQVVSDETCKQTYGTRCCTAINKYEIISASIDKFTRENPDMLILFAAGNDGQVSKEGSLGSPSACKNCICVGSANSDKGGFVDLSGDETYNEKVHNVDSVSSFSSRGPTFDGRIKPDVIAIGHPVRSVGGDGKLDNDVKQCTREQTTVQSGTSMATPAVAGLSALVRQYFVEGYFVNGEKNTSAAISPSGMLIKAAILNSGQPMSGFVNQNGNGNYLDLKTLTYPNSIYGYGVVNLRRTLPLKASNYDIDFKDRVPITANQKVEYCYKTNINSKKVFKVTLVWYDSEASESASITLKNDLNLRVTYNSQTYLGNGVEDNRNTNEHVLLKDVKDNQEIKVEVVGKNIVDSDIKFALVVTGNFGSCGAEARTTTSLANDDNDNPSVIPNPPGTQTPAPSKVIISASSIVSASVFLLLTMNTLLFLWI